MDYLLILWFFLISIGINYVFFACAYLLKTDAFTDITYTASFTLLSVIAFAWQQNFSVYQILIFILMNLWALRLGGYLLIRIRKIKIDHRFDKFRNSFVKFGGFWTLQGVSVFLIAIPGLFALTINQNIYLNNDNFTVIILAVVALGALLIESWADLTKFKFYNHRKSSAEILTTGIWKVSRHPNYFGEILFWFCITSIFLIGFFINNSIAITDNALQMLWFLSPIYIMLLINFVSGVPLLELKAYQAHCKNPDYVSYLQTTPCVVPFIGKRGNVQRVRKYLKKIKLKARGLHNESNS